MLITLFSSNRTFCLIAGFISALLLNSPMMGLATHFEGGKSIHITAPVTGDSYLAGREISVEAPIKGDLVAAGGKIVVLDSIYQDLQIAAGDVNISGYVGDDIRIAGGDVILTGKVAGDVVIAGGTLKIDKEAVIEGDLIIGGGEVELAGTVKGNLKASGGVIDFTGKVGQNAKFTSSQLNLNGAIQGTSLLQAENIKLGENAKFHGDVEYWQNSGEMDFGASLTNATATFNPELELAMGQEDWNYLGLGFFRFWIMRLLGMTLIMALLIWMFNKKFAKAAQTILDRPTRSMGFGFLYLIGIPVIALLLLVIVIGIPLGLFTLVNFLFSLLFVHALSMLILAHLINIRYDMDWSKGKILLLAALGFIVLKLITWIPIGGTIVSIVLASTALGALIMPLFDKKVPAEAIETVIQ